MSGKLIEIGDFPKCPRCGWDQFDDWWHALDPITARGKLVCECGRFWISGAPGRIVTSSCFGTRKPDYRPSWTPPTPVEKCLGNPVTLP